MTDPRNGLIWKRCAEGFNWNGSSCRIIGNDTEVNRKTIWDWIPAMEAAKASRFLGKNDWRLPTKDELLMIAGESANCRANDSSKGQFAVSKKIAHRVNTINGVGYFYSSTPADDIKVYLVAFEDGGVGEGVRDGGGTVRHVRSSTSNSSDTLEFEIEFNKTERYNSKLKQQAQERRDQTARDEQYRRDAPAREARQRHIQMCEAQKQTCLAGCGPITYWNGRSFVDNPSYSSCDYRCSQIRCN